ncbi:MAG: SBBP repeat-containing protein [Bacteroidales bacterium]|jgi:hypothetical protein
MCKPVNLKIVIAIIIFGSMNINSFAQTTFKWGKQFGSGKEVYVMNHVVDSKGNIYISGRTTGNIGGENLGQNDGFLMKTDSAGNIVWKKQFCTTGNENIQWSAIDDSDCVCITGSTTGSLAGKNAGKEDIFVIKYSPDGKMLWVKQTGTDSTDVAKGICTDHSGNIYITGMTLGNLGNSSSGKSDGFVIKFDPDGNQLFCYQFGTPDDDSGSSITCESGKIYLCGTTFGDLACKNKGFIDVFTGEITDKGEPVKFIQSGTEGFDIPMDIKVDKEKNIYVGGNTSGNWGCQQAGEGDCFLMKIDDSWKILWVSQFGTKDHDGIRSVALNDKVSDNILVSGLIHLPPANAFIRMIRKDGTTLWERQIIDEGKSGDASGKSVTIDNDGNIYHVGLTGADLFGPLSGSHDFYLVKLRLDPTLKIQK